MIITVNLLFYLFVIDTSINFKKILNIYKIWENNKFIYKKYNFFRKLVNIYII